MTHRLALWFEHMFKPGVKRCVGNTYTHIYVCWGQYKESTENANVPNTLSGDVESVRSGC